MTIGGWCCMTFAFAVIGGLFGWCCWKMCFAFETNGETPTTDEG